MPAQTKAYYTQNSGQGTDLEKISCYNLIKCEDRSIDANVTE